MRKLIPFVFIAGWLGVQGARPAPAMPAAEDAAALRTDLAEIITRPGWTGDRWSVMVTSLDRGDTLFAHGAAESLAPASNMKLFTTAAALYYLGPDFRFNTFLMSTGPIRDGVLDGDLVVYGTGDPTFSSRFGDRLDVWRAFADTLVTLGVREVRGDIVGDGSYFEGSGAGEGWQQSYMNASYAATAGALSFSENIALLEIAPGEEAGWRPTVRLVPGGEGIAIVNEATTVASGTTRITAARVAYDGPIRVTGQIARGARPVQRSVPVSDPERFSAAMLREMLNRQGITVTGTVRSARAASESPVTSRSVFAPAFDSQSPVHVLAVHTSPPLLEVLGIINRQSHNLMAEQVLRTVGRVAVGTGSVEGGARAVRHMMETEGYATDGIEIYDGSGLSVLNRSSAGGIVALLEMMAGSAMWETYHATLPAAGEVGLRRMQQTGAAGNLRAKTGTINNVSALSGYVTASNGERLAFSIISNEVPSTWMAKRVEDAIGARLAAFDRPTPVAGTAVPDATGTGTDTAAATQAAPDTAPTAANASTPDAAAEPPAARAHTVRSGDTLDGIARRYGTTVRALEQANPGLNPRRLQLGQVIKLP